jgi:hypothetical protein
VVQAVEHLLSKLKALSSNLNTIKKNFFLEKVDSKRLEEKSNKKQKDQKLLIKEEPETLQAV